MNVQGECLGSLEPSLEEWGGELRVIDADIGPALWREERYFPPPSTHLGNNVSNGSGDRFCGQPRVFDVLEYERLQFGGEQPPRGNQSRILGDPDLQSANARNKYRIVTMVVPEGLDADVVDKIFVLLDRSEN